MEIIMIINQTIKPQNYHTLKLTQCMHYGCSSTYDSLKYYQFAMLAMVALRMVVQYFLLSVQFCNIIPYCDKIIMIIYRVVKSLSHITIQGLQWVCYFHLLAILLTGYDQQWVVVANEDFPWQPEALTGDCVRYPINQ